MSDKEHLPQKEQATNKEYSTSKEHATGNEPRADFQRPVLTLPNQADKLLLHSCCAPCSGEVMEAITASGIQYTIFFYNPNIHPQREYLIRKEENMRFAEKQGIPFVDADYDSDNWFERAKGMEWELERGIRCTMCFDMRFERTALYAHEHGFSVISSSLGISRWKNMQQITQCGVTATSRYPGMTYWDYIYGLPPFCKYRIWFWVVAYIYPASGKLTCAQ
ncbi:MAG: epoxyqueuosine reductase QueH, partial [Dickeya sp.]